ncbi:hypothetical protein [Oceanispirochaeta sp.]|jgi:hypothetical protein|uniref:hypothetical protein n=1 Tax=Oceanispirochaeta sp. TaxID=2035350 RepID=UPI0026336980|nr:hypothetical protein [Oceanispirochaeta sp.]MDA3956992.1 hypothetical protein [Oceanispirochaeta sp.]
MRIFKINLLLLFLISQLLYSQTSLIESNGDAKETTPPANQEFQDLPGAYRSISLGMTFDETKEKLLVESRFDFRGDPDVSIQKEGTQALISSKGQSFIDQGFFQFHEKRLYLIILQLDRTKIDFFSIQKSMISKYGPPRELSPEGMYWSNDKIKVSLEYPLTVKYLDLEVFNTFLDENIRLKSFQEVARSEFLEDF